MAQRAQTVEGVELTEPAIDPHGGHQWHPPALADNAKATLAAGDGVQGILAAVGNWANYEVWCDVPQTWLETELILRLTNGELVDELDRRTPAELEHMTVSPDGSGAGVLDRPGVLPTARIRGLLFSNYGRPGYGSLEVAAVRGQETLTGGKFYIRMWGTEGTSMGDRVGRPIVDRWARRNQHLSFANPAVTAGEDTNVFGGFSDGTFAPAPGVAARTVHVSDVVISGDQGAAEVAMSTLLIIEPVSGTEIVKGEFLTVRGGPIVANWALPITGRRGWNWVWRRGAGAGNLAITVGGYVA